MLVNIRSSLLGPICSIFLGLVHTEAHAEMTIVAMAVNSGSTTSLSNGNQLVASITMVSAPTKLGSSGFTLRSMTLSPVTSLGNESDLDGDGIPNDLDEDDDNDGVIDVEDAFPLDPDESEDTDGDGVGNNSDDDDDNDGLMDTKEGEIGTDPKKPDTDNDSLSDYFEWKSNSRDPLTPDYQLEIGWQTACFSDESGVNCWGKNDYGLREPPGLSNISALSMSGVQACAVTGEDRRIDCWGLSQAPQPQDIGYDDVAVGQYHSCTLRGKSIECQSSVGNQYGLLSVPDSFETDPKSLETGNLHACAVLESGKVECWGAENQADELSREDAGISPETIFSAFDSSSYTNCGAVGESLECYGQFANEIEALELASGGIYGLSVQGAAICAVGSNGVSCGGNVDGTPIPSPDFSTTSSAVVSVGNSFACAIDGLTVKCWGYDPNGLGVLVPPAKSLGDYDSDGITDDVDSDDDNDGVNDIADKFPLNASESLDTDGDGIGNNSDNDDDGDSYVDIDEISAGTDPLDANSYPREDEQVTTGMPIWLYYIVTESSKASKHPE